MDRRRWAVDMRSPVPSYKQLADKLRDAITSGEIAADTPLPSLNRLVQETGLAMSTVQHAVRVLMDEGLAYGVPGRGTFAGPRDG